MIVAGMECTAVPEQVNFNKPEFHNKAGIVANSLEELK